jgi:excinuclease ABC subunit B
MQPFELVTAMIPTGDQPEAISALIKKIKANTKATVLVGVTGSGKTFTMANVIAACQMPTLVISHNKTLAAQLYQEFRDFFPKNAVSYFVSYYDYYQPESYIPQTDTYIEKETEINEEIDKLRLAATTNILTRPDTIVVASVSCIYNIGSPREYGHFVLELATGTKIRTQDIVKRLVQLQYSRNQWNLDRGTFRYHGDTIDIFPAYEDAFLHIEITNDTIQTIELCNQTTGKTIAQQTSCVIYPAKHYMTDASTYKPVFKQIEADLETQVKKFTTNNQFIESQRIRERVTHDLEMIQELGYVNGIENYSRYFDGRKPGDAPFTLFDYFQDASKGKPWLLIVDESHMTIPQIRGMYNGDRSRKQTLIDYGFRLPSALDNRPLQFDEFLRRIPQTVFVSATPDEWELSYASGVVEQLVRPTGLIDPTITIKPVKGQIDDLIKEISIRVAKHQRILVTTLTKQMAEDLTTYLKEKNYRVAYLHSDILTLDRTAILAQLRKGDVDIIIGVNLLREGLDLPEVSLVAILDADKEGFLRSKVSLIQTMGRAARHEEGAVILYADTITKSITNAISEVERRRTIQRAYNKKFGITPKGIQKPIREGLADEWREKNERADRKRAHETLTKEQIASMTAIDKQKEITKLQTLMKRAIKSLYFEQAAEYRDRIVELQQM